VVGFCGGGLQRWRVTAAVEGYDDGGNLVVMGFRLWRDSGGEGVVAVVSD
jgi:hypothetical protein